MKKHINTIVYFTILTIVIYILTYLVISFINWNIVSPFIWINMMSSYESGTRALILFGLLIYMLAGYLIILDVIKSKIKKEERD